jgi:hypothetical protein
VHRVLPATPEACLQIVSLLALGIVCVQAHGTAGSKSLCLSGCQVQRRQRVAVSFPPFSLLAATLFRTTWYL